MLMATLAPCASKRPVGMLFTHAVLLAGKAVSTKRQHRLEAEADKTKSWQRCNLKPQGCIYKAHQAPLQHHLETEADKAKPWRRCNFKAQVGANKALEDVREPDVMADVVLKPLGPIRPYDKPQLQRSESSAKRYLPILQIRHPMGHMATGLDALSVRLNVDHARD